ncbi:MAG TPA: NUDIX domain-containing protein [Terriglobia bacterium]|nr:NUDIX domain-containing protein [Terriglobia bacterium]
MPKPVKHSVAIVVRNGDRILAIRRPDNDDELPGIWGLPAGTCRGQETVEDVINRIGRDKLGVQLDPVCRLTSGAQDRPRYRLNMELWEASMEGSPTHPEWQWAPLDLLQPGAAAGSLCCELAIKSKSRASL